MSGFIVFDKPNRMSSRQAVDRVESWFPGEKVGHAGTLDPMATGVLVMAIGKVATALIQYVQLLPKVYRSKFKLGVISDTDDATGQLTEVISPAIPSMKQIQVVLTRWVGEVKQIPPQHSAVHSEGQRAYILARQGMEISLTAKPVRIDRLNLLHFDYPLLEIEVECGKGTYIRSLARDIGSELGCGGMVAELRRMSIGAFTLDEAVPWNATPYQIQKAMRPISMGLAAASTMVGTPKQITDLRHGRTATVLQPDQPDIIVLDGQGDLVAMGSIQQGKLKPRRVFGAF